MSAVYIPGKGIAVTINGQTEGLTILLPPHMTIAAIQRHIAEVAEWLA